MTETPAGAGGSDQPQHPQPGERARVLVRGGYDLHVHVGPDVMPRRINDLELARRFHDYGLAGFALKSHDTVSLTVLVQSSHGQTYLSGDAFDRR